MWCGPFLSCNVIACIYKEKVVATTTADNYKQLLTINYKINCIKDITVQYFKYISNNLL